MTNFTVPNDVTYERVRAGLARVKALDKGATQAVSRGQRLLCTAASNAVVDHLTDLCLDKSLSTLRVGPPRTRQ